MAEDLKQKPENKETPPVAEEATTPEKRAFLKRFLTARWLLILVGASVLLHGVGLAYSRMAGSNAAQTVSPEVSLGMFQFEADPSERGRIAAAEFSLHIALLEHVEQAARRRLADRKFRVEQDVEELLRKAHSGDFDDPDLGELKRQVQEQINETLGMRAIADVIITDLKLTRSEHDLGAVTDTAEAVPWVEEPSS